MIKKILYLLILTNISFVYPKKIIEKQRLIYPLREIKITSTIGDRKGSRFHWGIDFNAITGTQIIAPIDMKIIESGYAVNYGNYIIGVDEDNFNYLFAHLSKRIVKVDDLIKQGETIGLTGNTGYSFGPHLHYEISYRSVYFNPIDFQKNNFNDFFEQNFF